MVWRWTKGIIGRREDGVSVDIIILSGGEERGRGQEVGWYVCGSG